MPSGRRSSGSIQSSLYDRDRRGRPSRPDDEVVSFPGAGGPVAGEAVGLPYFHDSNVLIGYYFHAADGWSLAATRVFDDPEPNYSSTSVWEECFGFENDGRCATVQKKIRREFRRAIAALKRDLSVEMLEKEVAITRTRRDAAATKEMLKGG
ncbi:MAG: hypothetical protein PHQ81_01950 [Methanofollis sp.]|nr:hypothetical protein [Methanofollis sp.]